MMNTKIAIVTGASRGIGLATSLALSQEGYQVFMAARSFPATLELPTNCVAVPTDITQESEVKALFERSGRPNVLVNNAGIGHFKPITDLSVSEWDSVMAVNGRGMFLCSREAMRLMTADQTGGTIINVTSDVARRVFKGGALYCASKYAQDAFTNVLRLEGRPHGVRVSAIMTGLVRTSFNGSPTEAEEKDWWLSAEEVAKAICYAATAPKGVEIDEILLHPTGQEWGG